MVLYEQTWELVLLLVKAEQWNYLELKHECCTVRSDNLKRANLGEGDSGVCELVRASQLGDISGEAAK